MEAALHGAGVMCLLQVLQRNYFLPSRIGTVLLDLDALRRAPPTLVTVEHLDTSLDTAGPLPLRRARFNVFLEDAQGTAVGGLFGLQMVGGPDAPADPRTLVTSGAPFRVGGFPFLGVAIDDVTPWLPAALPGVAAETNSSCGTPCPFSPVELARVREFPVDKRRREWLAGRLAVKVLVQDLAREAGLATLPLDLLTAVSEQAPPRLVAAAGLDPKAAAFLAGLHLSLAHAGGMAVATAARQPVGIDIEPVKPLAAGVAERFLTPRERGEVPGPDQLALWTAKEAAAKALGVGFGVGDFTRLEAVGFGYNEPYRVSVAGRSEPVSCLTFRDSGYVVSIAWTVS